MTYSKCHFLWDWSFITKMTLLKQLLKTEKLKTTPPTVPDLCNPGKYLEPREAAISQDTNDAVHKNNFSSPVSKPRKTKQEEFNNFDEEQRAKVGRNAVGDGVARATNRFMAERLGVRSIRDRYIIGRKASGTMY